MNIVIFGPQGSGKGTQADILAERLNIPHITTGGLLRSESAKETELGNEIKDIMDAGNLAPDNMMLEILKNRLEQPDAETGFILDGYPRNLNQAGDLEQCQTIDVAMEICISDEEALRRTGGRLTCEACGAVFNLLSNPPKTEGVCDRCGGRLKARDDDKEAVIKQRLAVYHRQTELLVKYYQKSGNYLKIDGMPPIPEVTKEIFEKLKLN